MKFNLATESDIDEICALVKSAISNMDRNDIFQWDEIYPTREDFLSDIKSGNLYTGITKNAETTGEKIAVVFALNKCQDEAYKSANWTYNGEDFCVIHRLCVNPEFQNQGIAKTTLKYIEEKLKNSGKKSIQLDVFTQNPFALRLYEKAGFHQTGTADWRKGKFLLMEKIL